MKEKNNKYIQSIIFIIFVAILKLNPYTNDPRIVKNVIKIDGTAYNLVPFSTISEYIINFNNYNLNIILRFFIINLILYMPLGILLNLKGIKQNNKLNLLILLLTPVIIEFLQVFLSVGVFDIDSIILNIIGSISLYVVINKRNVNN